MANFDELKERIAERIRTNGTGEITGQVMQDTLLDMVNTMGEEIGGAIEGVTVAVDSYVGTPSASATLQNKVLNFLFRNLKGEQGDSAVFDPNTGNILASLHNTTGYDDANAMTQKAVTDELDNRTSLYEEMDLSEYTVYNWFIQASSNKWLIGSTNNQCVVIPVSPGDVIKAVGRDNGQGGFYTPQVVFLTTNTRSDGAPAPYAGGEQTYPAWPSGVTKIAPSDAAFMYVRLKTSGSNVTPTLYKVESLKEDYTEIKAEVIDIEQGVKKNTIVPSYFFGSIASSGYNLTNYGNKVTRELKFDPDVISSITIHRRGNEVKFALYTITGDVITSPTGYITEDYTFTPISGVKYVIRIVSTTTGTQTRAKMEAVPVSSYPELVINYANTSDCIGNIDGKLRKIGEKYYGYSRNYSNITPLLTFEHKSISNEGIADSQSSLLAKIPSIGCVEVKMNKPAGGFSVWKKVGNTITCLQAYTHYQYRYTGDYSSEYYVMLEAESGESLNTAIATVYTYSDEGIASGYAVPSWATGAKVAFIGDSIVQGRYPKNGSDSVNICMDKPWPNLVAEALGTEDFINFAIGGALVYNNDWRSLQRNAPLVVGYDIVFICGGSNDYGNKTSQADFEAAYSDMLDSLIANNTKVIVMTPVRRTKTVSSPVMPLVNYAVSIMEVAASKNVPVIDTIKLTDTPEFEQHLVDGLHPDEIGQRMIADALLEAIKYIE